GRCFALCLSPWKHSGSKWGGKRGVAERQRRGRTTLFANEPKPPVTQREMKDHSRREVGFSFSRIATFAYPAFDTDTGCIGLMFLRKATRQSNNSQEQY
ncbi:hypothetical protein KTQ37_16550, partial [Sinorhodobacter sp. B57]|nr:hypothetical protein [Sedimentimonas flavescens]